MSFLPVKPQNTYFFLSSFQYVDKSPTYVVESRGTSYNCLGLYFLLLFFNQIRTISVADRRREYPFAPLQRGVRALNRAGRSRMSASPSARQGRPID